MTGWSANVTRAGEMKNAYRIFVENLLRNIHLRDLKEDGRITLG